MSFNGRPVLALIPARGGSKGLPRKNLAMLAGKPLVGHTIEAAKSSHLIDDTWVSSEDAEILSLAANSGARPLLRPDTLADDMASAVGVVEHFISFLSDEIQKMDPVIVYLQPTSPLRRVSHIDSALYAMSRAGANSTFSVVEADKSPFKAFQLDDEGKLISLFDQRLSNARRQDLSRCYFPNGAIYAFTVSAFKAANGFPSNGSIPFIMSTENSIDIDTADDLLRAEVALGARHGRI
jgi:CMP-N,N'-diacetyllegionaminic acid synthase